MNAPSRPKIQGITEDAWMRCTNPLHMPKVLRHWPSRLCAIRKCGLLSCAYVLHSSVAFTSPAAVRIAKFLQQQLAEALPSNNIPASLPDKLLKAFPSDLTESPYGLRLASSLDTQYQPDSYRLSSFIYALCRGYGRGGVNDVATVCLNHVRLAARTKCTQDLETLRVDCIRTAFNERAAPSLTGWRRALARWVQPATAPPAPPVQLPLDPMNPPGYREAVIALLPETERAVLGNDPWTDSRARTRVLGRLGTLAAEAQVSALGKEMTNIVRGVLGNPFRPVNVPSEWREANFGAALRIAEHIVATGNYGDVPILADALEDAGCTDEELLSFCRTGEHYPGCWVVDAVLGKH